MLKNHLKYTAKIPNLEFNNWIYFEHLRMSVMCLCDRFILKYDPDSYNFIYEHGERVTKI
ncbi:MAG: hypothetical protein R2837_00895 [Aliarcobacter sp.]